MPRLGQRERPAKMPTLGQAVPRVASLVDDEYARLLNALEDAALVRRIIKLKRQFPLGTYPELVVMDWLNRRALRYEFQFRVLGGRAIMGGQVLDFVIDQGRDVLILEVNGVYWHTRPGKTRIDEAQKYALLGLRIWGKPVGAVITVWDSRIMDKRRLNPVMQMALAHIELGP